jgi:WD40 repeat protein
VIDTLGHLPDAPPAPLASGAGGWRLCASGRTLVRLGGGSRTIELPNAVAALAVAPDGARVAIGHAGGITLWAGGDRPRRLSAKGVHGDLAWSPDARCIVSATRTGDVVLWDARTGECWQVDEGRDIRRAIGITADGTHLVTSGSALVACWNLATLQLVPCGVGSKDAVLAVACHPRRPLVAAGYANGAVLICRPASTDVIFVRGAGGGAIDVLAWSPDGTALGFGVSSGEVGLVALPDLLFRDDEGRAP